MPWLDRLALAAGRLAGTRGAILCFHGLDLDDARAGASMHVRLEHFQLLVEAAARIATIVPLQEIVTRQLAGRSTSGLVALTADDAYASWLAAEPFLIRNRIPLTLFAVHNALEAGSIFWWDRIDDSAVRTRPDRWRQFEEECGLPDVYRRGHGRAGTERPMRQWLLAEFAGRCPEAVGHSLDRLEAELDHRTRQRSMTRNELAGFLARTGVQLGVHTLSHPALPFLPDQELISEVRLGLERLRVTFPDTLPYLAIPFGLFDARTLELTARAGMTVSLTLEGNPLDRPFEAELGMPRLCIVREHQPGRLILNTSGVAGILKRLRRGPQHTYPALPSPTT